MPTDADPLQPDSERLIFKKRKVDIFTLYAESFVLVALFAWFHFWPLVAIIAAMMIWYSWELGGLVDAQNALIEDYQAEIYDANE